MQAVDMVGMFPVPKPYRAMTIDQWAARGRKNDEEAYKTAKYWYDNHPMWFGRIADDHPTVAHGQGLVMVGAAGTGKTSFASAMLNEFLTSGQASGAFIMDGDLDRIYRRNDNDDDSMFDWLVRVSCLVYDDILRLGGNEHFVEWVIRSRYNNGVPTIITLNNGVRLGDVLTSLLSPFTWARFEGKDLRRLNGGR